eukprot:scaffold7333_cov48-Phaeocystis_antarctica.AAC.2
MHACGMRIQGWPAYSLSPSAAQMVLEHRASGKSSTAASAATRCMPGNISLGKQTRAVWAGDI